MVYKELIGTTAGAGLLYLLTGNFWATLFGGLLGYYATEKLYDNPNQARTQTASIKDVKNQYPAYVSS